MGFDRTSGATWGRSLLQDSPRLTFCATSLVCLAVLTQIIAFMALPAPARAAEAIYVSADGSDTAGDGSAGNPYMSVTRGLSEASAGTTVSVFPGSYCETTTGERFPLLMKSGVVLRGSGALVTTLQGRRLTEEGLPAGSVIEAVGVDSTTKISGFTITGGMAEWGGGIYCPSSTMRISENIIRGNEAGGPQHREHQGGGIYCTDAVEVLDNIIDANEADSGDGIWCAGAAAISGNTISGQGTGVFLGIFSEARLTGNTFSDNVVAVYSIAAGEARPPQICNNVITGGRQGIYAEGYPGPTVVNSTISGNTVGIVAPRWSIIRNCILRNTDDLAGCSATYSDISSAEDSAGVGNICADPEFVDATTGDYHLGPTSPCIDAGTNTDAPTIDRDGVSRPQDGDADGVAMVDMGAYELKPSAPPAPAVIYVSADGSDTAGDGSAGNPYRSITRGMSEAATGSTIRVGEGTYSNTESGEVIPIHLKPGVSLLGSEAASTTIDGEREGPIIAAEDLDETATIDGFTITEGWGGGIHCADATLCVSRNVIRGNQNDHGGGIFAESSRVEIVSNEITHNAGGAGPSHGWGGGICCLGSEATIAANTIAGNVAGSSGGGIACSGRAFISGNTIRDNVVSGWWTGGGDGGGIACSAEATIVNNVIASNRAPSGYYGGGVGGGISCAGAKIVNNTIAGNSTATQYGPGTGGGVYVHYGAARIVNCIIWGNGDDLANCSATYSGISNADDAVGIGNISADPEFEGPVAGDYHLLRSSPCVDAGTNEDAPALDKDGVTRPQDGDGDGTAVCDMGAYERPVGEPPAHSSTLTMSAFSTDVPVGGTVALRGSLTATTGPVRHREVTVWHRAVTVPTWSQDGTATYNEGLLTYDAEGVCTTDTVFRMQFAGDGWYWPATSNEVMVRVHEALHVSPEGSDITGDGSLIAPYKSITMAMSVAQRLDTIRVAPGLYSGGSTGDVFPIFPKSGVVLQGAGAALTTIQGDGTHPVFRAIGVDGAAKIDAFTIRGGHSDVDHYDENGGGGIVCGGGSTLTISNNVITENTAAAQYGGGGILCDTGAVPTISGNTIARNSGGWCGGGISCVGGSRPLILANRITDNTAVFGGGVRCGYEARPTIANNVIDANRAAFYGGGVCCNGSSGARITGNTIVNNIADDLVGGGVTGEPSVDIVDCIIWNNGDDLHNCSATYSDISSADDIPGAGNISVDPRFVDGAAGDYHLRADSGCIDSGTNTGAPGVDKEGAARPQDGDADGAAVCDMGAYERASPGSSGILKCTLRLECAQANVRAGDTAALAGSLESSLGPARDRAVTLWRRPMGVPVWSQDGTATYNPVTMRYDATPTCDAKTVFQMRFAGDASREAAVSNELTVTTHTDLWVSGSGSDTSGDGSVAKPYRSITKGMLNAWPGDTVHVASGVYSQATTGESFPIGLTSGVVLQGAGAGNSVIQGSELFEGSLVVAENVNERAKIDGFTIRGARNSQGHGGAIKCIASRPTISHNTIAGNTTSNYGGGIACLNSADPRIVGNTISGNYATGYGGGICCCDGSSPEIIGNLISGNGVSYSGGGIACVSESNPTVVANTLTGNYAEDGGPSPGYGGWGGGLSMEESSDATVANNVITGNRAILGGAVHCWRTAPTLYNNTIVANSTSGGAAVHGQAKSSPTIVNCVFWGNGDDLANCSATYSVILSQDDTDGVGNISADPAFIDAATGDYRLLRSSPCVDTGTNEGAPATDKDGVTRPQDGDDDGVAIADMGAYELRPGSPTVACAIDLTASTRLVKFGGLVRLTATLEASAGPVENHPDVVLYRVAAGGALLPSGAAAFNAQTRSYEVTRTCTENSVFVVRHAGDSVYAAAASSPVTVYARAYLSRPRLLRASTRRGTMVSVFGYVKPRHNGSTRVYFYRWVSGRWLRVATVHARNSDYHGYTMYRLNYRPRLAGTWRVRAEHGDANHAWTTSPMRAFIVR